MGWCQWVYDQVRASATAKASPFPASSSSGREGFIELPPPERDYVLFEDFRRDPERHPLKTPVRTDRDRLRRRRRLRAMRTVRPHPAWLPPAEWLGGAGAERWPLHLVTHQPASRLHSQMDPGPVSRGQKISDREPIRINPPDAARRGIRDGDIVRAFNARGACLAGAVIDSGVMRRSRRHGDGRVVRSGGHGGAPERHGNPNVLTLDVGTSPLAQGTSALTALVEIERWDAPAPAVRAFTPPQLAPVG